MQQVDDILKAIKPPTRSVQICLDGSIGERLQVLHSQLSDALAESHTIAGGDIAELRQEIAEVEGEAEGSTVEFTVKSIGSKAWRRLKAEYPPTTEQVLEGWTVNPEAFPVAATAASTVDPEMDEQQADELAEKLTDHQWEKLYKAVCAVNVGDDLIPKSGLGTAATPTSESLSTTADPEASPSPSSTETD